MSWRARRLKEHCRQTTSVRVLHRRRVHDSRRHRRERGCTELLNSRQRCCYREQSGRRLPARAATLVRGSPRLVLQHDLSRPQPTPGQGIREKRTPGPAGPRRCPGFHRLFPQFRPGSGTPRTLSILSRPGAPGRRRRRAGRGRRAARYSWRSSTTCGSRSRPSSPVAAT
jgi:hypothetical protein